MPPNMPSPVPTQTRPPPQPTHVSPLKLRSHVPDSDRGHLTMTSLITSLLPSPEAEKSLFRAAYIAETTRLQAQHKVDSISEAHSVIASILHRRLPEDIWPYFKIAREISMSELRDIGRMGRRNGIRACGTLVRLPGIHEGIADALWEALRMHMGIVDEEDDEQDMFERDIVLRAQKEQEEERNDGTAEEKGKARGEAMKCVLCTGSGPGCQLPRHTLEKYQRKTDGKEVLWQREDRCPCHKQFGEGKRMLVISDDRISGAYNEGDWVTGLPSPSAPSTPSIRSKVSQIFVWGRRTDQ